MDSAFAVVLAYLIGSLDFGVIVPRALGVDIYSSGSGNPGTSNVFRTMGKKAAGMVLAGDALKGFVAVAVVDAWIGGPTAVAAGLAAVSGHIFPVWHRFKGGKGVATAIGAALWLEPIFGGILAAAWVGVVLVTRTASIASLMAMLLLVPGLAVAGRRGADIWWAAAIAAVVVVRHGGNIRRLAAGKEQSVEGL